MKRRLICAALCVCMAGSLLLAGTGAEAKKKVNKAGKYHAALGLETTYSRSVHREAYYEGTDGKVKEKKLAAGTQEQNNYLELAGTFQDAVIKGNGTYTVSLKNANFNYNRSFKKIYVATDIPNTKEIKFSNVSISVNGSVLRTFSKPVLDSGEHKSNCVLLILDPDNAQVRNSINSTVPRSTENEIKVMFTVKGFSYKKGEKPSAPTPKPTKAPKEDALKKEDDKTETGFSEAVETTEPLQSNETEVENAEVTLERKIGISLTVVFAIGAILVCVVVVNKRQH